MCIIRSCGYYYHWWFLSEDHGRLFISQLDSVPWLLWSGLSRLVTSALPWIVDPPPPYLLHHPNILTSTNIGSTLPVPEATLLLIAHKGSYDVFTRGLRGLKPRLRKQFRELVNLVPFAAVGCCRESLRDDGQHKGWELCDPGFPPLTHKASPNYDWKIWL